MTSAIAHGRAPEYSYAHGPELGSLTSSLPDANDASARTTAVAGNDASAHAAIDALGTCFTPLWSLSWRPSRSSGSGCLTQSPCGPSMQTSPRPRLTLTIWGCPAESQNKNKTDAGLLSYGLADDASQCPVQAFASPTALHDTHLGDGYVFILMQHSLPHVPPGHYHALVIVHIINMPSLYIQPPTSYYIARQI
jgi:hypothetical protein